MASISEGATAIYPATPAMTVDAVMGSWAAPAAAAGADQHPSNPTSDTACSSPQDTPLAKIVQQGAGSAPGAVAIPTNPTPPLSASSQGLGASNVAAWRAGSYPQHGIPVPVSYPAAGSFASPIAGALDAMPLEHAPMPGDYYYAAASGNGNVGMSH
ncbi:hypothetical protein H4R21_006680, partial [Coemansia helicoidea]